MPISDNHRKLIWAGATLFGIFYVAPWAIHNARIASSQPPPAEAKPSAAHVAPAEPKPIDPEQTLKAQAARVAGDWKGSGIIPGRGPCMITLQIHPDPLTPGGYSAFSTTGCHPNYLTLGQDRQKAMDTLLKGATPTSIIMSGTAVKGDLVFHVDKAIGVPPDGCPWTGMTVSPFGEQVASEWQAGTCAGGQMILNRVTNVR